MTDKNKYSRRAKISERKFREMVKLFALDLNAKQIAELTKINRNTINRYLKALRQKIAEFCELESPFSGEVEVDESWFGAKRVKGKRGRGAAGKTMVFGIFKRNGKVYTEIVPNGSCAILQAVIRGKVTLDSVIHSGGWRGYNGLVDLGYSRHFRVDHEQNQFVQGRNHINGIEGFWGFAKVRLVQFRGLLKHSFYLHLNECEFRYNYRGQNIYKILLKLIRKNPLF